MLEPPSSWKGRLICSSHLNNRYEEADVRAPNGEDICHYGPYGGPVPPSFVPLDDVDLNPIEALLAYRLLNPFLDFVGSPIKKAMKSLLAKLGLITNSAPDVRSQESTGGGVIAAVAKAITLAFCTLQLAAAIGTLDAIDGSQTRLTVMTIFALVFSSTCNFFGKDSLPIYSLNAA
ncbi:uncharacterized protein BDR25DRAFT_316749 [Lindgomyces ingoldianus]|uniref:Uncharacterized protein n=1 Tax=Lindgomyces ingoldianus TaxID=673940 RepID=A0ACB6QMP7_9PLEO|nr:uncharacterized protein BDR25DRAFT_316749 [Lindgomyces ingoldianus]KAF2467392.1 hypothetical protein BDR25DRAFT_316749 [Lindgomyces ingoldianus]